MLVGKSYLAGRYFVGLLILILVSLSMGVSEASATPQQDCWSFTDEASCNNATQELGCIWKSGGSWGWCEEKGCWNYFDESSCISNNCTWDPIGQYCFKQGCWGYENESTCIQGNCEWTGYGYCYKENCWDLADKASCQQANQTLNISCRWDSTYNYCYEVGPWEYTTNESCVQAGFSWEASGGWCSDIGCWDYTSKSTCDAQDNCKWEGSSWCRAKGCQDFKDSSSCLNESDSFDCGWDSQYNYCYEKGCWNYNNQTACESTADSLTCAWNSDGQYCYEATCYDFSTQSACETNGASLGCYWDSEWKECKKKACWEYYNESSCESGTENLDCRWRTTGWCNEYSCWDFNTSTSCNEHASDLNCLWQEDIQYCYGPTELNCWDYMDSSSCTAAGCTWKVGECTTLGCWNYGNQSACESTLDDLNCIWKTDEGGGAWCEEKACWSYGNKTACEDDTDELTCAWDSTYNYCYKKGCWEYSNNVDCTNATAHPDLDCAWDSAGNYCYEPGCWSYYESTSCLNESDSYTCKWELSGGYCEENTTIGADCWSFTSNSTCSTDPECVWEDYGWCNEKENCWSYTTEADCTAHESDKRCAWDPNGWCYKRGCWDYYNETSCGNAVGCNWDPVGQYCYEEGCWKFADNASCSNTTDSMNCKWESFESCVDTESCWNKVNETSCEGTSGCNWVTGGWCEGGSNCWNYFDESSCINSNCTWQENSWCEELGPWLYTTNESCVQAGFKWKAEGGWCEEPKSLQCWNYDYNQTGCLANSECEWQNPWCVTKGCWSYHDEQSCSDSNAGCTWYSENVGGWCERRGCWEFNATTCLTANETYGLNCALEQRGHCEELGCWSYNNQTACETSELDCKWQNYTGGGWCEGPGNCWENNETNCTGDCIWKTGWCEEVGCWSFVDEVSCTNTSLHPSKNCTWRQEEWGSWCEEQGCWNYMNQTACVNNTLGLNCQWDSIYNYCYEPNCWDYGDENTCISQGCQWNTDPWGGGWCEEQGCWSFWNNQSKCENETDDFTCLWKEETFCEEARCWLFDFTNETTCVNNTYGLDCEWQDGWCTESYAGCSQYHGNELGCLETGYCWWDPFEKTCNDPASDWKSQMAGEIVNPGCWMFDFQRDKCQSVTGCTWDNVTQECNGLEDAGVRCSVINDRDLCENIPVLDTCCVWKNSKCEADKTSMRCFENIQPPPEGASFCEDYKAYTDQATCKKIMGEPWYMPCKWEDYGTADKSDDRCVFRAADKFGGEVGGCASITNKKDCEFAGCEWKQEFYCEGNKTVPFGWCEEKSGAGAKSCDAACWACEFNGTTPWSDESLAKAKCEGSKLGYCIWRSDPNAPNGLGYCEVSQDVLFGKGDCSTDCRACEKKDSPKAACEQSGAGCKWVSDTTGVTEIGGWCYPMSEKTCTEDCFKCYDEKSCVDYGGGSKDSCTWDADTKICKPVNYDKEICFDGEDNDNDGKIDCEDGDCFKDPFCGAEFLSNCWKYETKETCNDPSAGGAEGCIWISDPWTGEEWCGLKGENCFLWDGDETGCKDQSGGACQWYPDPRGGFCDVNITKTQVCSKLTSKGACVGNSDCTWIVDTDSLKGGYCEPRIFSCDDYTTQISCAADTRCAWVFDPDTGEQECAPICFSGDLDSPTTCGQNANCQWITGICDPAEGLGLSMEDCWKYDNNPTSCMSAPGCEWHEEMMGGFCDINKTLDETYCIPLNYSTCNSPPYNETCKWNGDEKNGWCDLKIFKCGWYTDQTTCEDTSYHPGVSCVWVGGSTEGSTTEGPGPSTPHCEPACFGQVDEASCSAQKSPTNLSLCAWRTGFCEPKMAKIMFEGMDSPPVPLGSDPCGDGTVPPLLDICGFGLKEMPDKLAFGFGVWSMEDAALCKGNRVVRFGSMEELTSSGSGTNTTKYYWYLDTDGSETGGCPLFNNASAEGYEFFLKYTAKWVDGELKEIRTAKRCEDGEWVIADVKLTGWTTLMCSEIGGPMIAIDKDDLRKFTDLFVPGEEMRVYVAAAGAGKSEINPLDTAGPSRYIPGKVDFKFEDCFLPGVDMDGDGLISEKDPDCFIFQKQGFVRYEDCFETGIDEDGDGKVDCYDLDCRFAPNCEGKGVNSPDYVDDIPPSLLWYEVDRFPDAAFIKYDTDEPANGTVTFFYNDSTCSGLNATGMNRVIYDIGIIDDFVPEFKNWHDAPIDNFEFNPQRLGYDLSNGTAYYYKIKVCDPDSNCAESACLSFNTTKSASRRDCPECSFLLKFEGLGDVQIDFGQGFERAGQCGVTGFKANYSAGLKVDIKLQASDANAGAIILEEATLTGLSETLDILGGTVNTTGGDTLGYVGINSTKYDKIASKLRPKKCTLTIPKGENGDCANIMHCDDPVNGTVNESTCAQLPSSKYSIINETSTFCVVRVPCDFSVYTVGTAETTTTTTTTTTGGGGGGAAPSCIKTGFQVLGLDLMDCIIRDLGLKYKVFYRVADVLASVFSMVGDRIGEWPAPSFDISGLISKPISTLDGDVYQLAVSKVRKRWAFAQGVVIARGDIPVDSMAAVAYAKSKGYPILLTRPDTLPDEVFTGVAALNPSKIVIAGGPVAVSTVVENRLGGVASVERIWGLNREETAVRLAESLESSRVIDTIVVANGHDPSPEATIVAAGYKAPIVYVAGDTVPQVTRDFLEDHKVTKDAYKRKMKIVFVDISDVARSQIEQIMQ